MTTEKEESLQVDKVQSNTQNGVLPFVRISENLEADEHGELGTPEDSVSDEKQPLMSEKEISTPTDPDLDMDEGHKSGQWMHDTERFQERKIMSEPNIYHCEFGDGFLTRSPVKSPLKPHEQTTHIPSAQAMAKDHDFLKRKMTLKRQENITYFSELQRMNVTICQAIYNRIGRSGQELTVDKGDVLEVLDSRGDWWKLKNYKGEVGHAPYIILQAVYGPAKKHNTKHYFSRKHHIVVMAISVAIIVLIIIIGVIKITRPPIP